MSGIFSCLVKDCRLIKAMDVVDDDDDDDDDDDGGLLLFPVETNMFPRKEQQQLLKIFTSIIRLYLNKYSKLSFSKSRIMCRTTIF